MLIPTSLSRPLLSPSSLPFHLLRIPSNNSVAMFLEKTFTRRTVFSNRSPSAPTLTPTLTSTPTSATTRVTRMPWNNPISTSTPDTISPAATAAIAATAAAVASAAAAPLSRKGVQIRLQAQFSQLRTSILGPPPRDPIRIVCLSDLHGTALSTLPVGDILIVAGGLSKNGLPAQLRERLDELSALALTKFQHVIVIAGASDRALSPACDLYDTERFRDLPERMAIRDAFRRGYGGGIARGRGGGRNGRGENSGSGGGGGSGEGKSHDSGIGGGGGKGVGMFNKGSDGNGGGKTSGVASGSGGGRGVADKGSGGSGESGGGKSGRNGGGGGGGGSRVGRVVYLDHEGCVVAVRGRALRVWGSPDSQTPENPHTAFAVANDEQARELWAQVPAGIDILVTHGPPRGYLDGGAAAGSAELTRALWRVRPALHVFGHPDGTEAATTATTTAAVVARYDAVQRAYEDYLDEMVRDLRRLRCAIDEEAGGSWRCAPMPAVEGVPVPRPMALPAAPANAPAVPVGVAATGIATVLLNVTRGPVVVLV